MPARKRTILLLSGVGLLLAIGLTGCQLQVAFVEKLPKSPPVVEQSTAKVTTSPEVIQQANYQAVQSGGQNVILPSPVPNNAGAANSGVRLQPTLPPGTIVPPQGNPVIVPGNVPGANQGSSGPLVNHGPVGPGPVGPGMNGPGGGPPPMPIVTSPPTEKAMTSLPPYVIEPPDVLLINPIRMIPKPPYTVGPFDVLVIRLAQSLPNQPIDGTFVISPEGTINLGYSYGVVQVGGMTLEEVERSIRIQLNRANLKDPQVAVGLAQYRGIQQTRGEHLVRQDGTVDLGSYGCVHVAGLTLAQAKVAIERHLCQYLLEPEVSVDVLAYNSKVYYVIFDGAGYGQSLYRLPITGKDTVLDAICQIQGLPAVASTRHIWVARPGPAHHPCMQILPVDWMAITQGGATSTNWQLFPGDRIYVQSDPLIKTDNLLAKFLAPIERILGLGLLAGSTYNTFRTNGGGNGGTSFIAPLGR